jgi:hypothetical protein
MIPHALDVSLRAKAVLNSPLGVGLAKGFEDWPFIREMKAQFVEQFVRVDPRSRRCRHWQSCHERNPEKRPKSRVRTKA